MGLTPELKNAGQCGLVVENKDSGSWGPESNAGRHLLVVGAWQVARSASPTVSVGKEECRLPHGVGCQKERDKGLMGPFSKLPYVLRGRGHRVLDGESWIALDLPSKTNSHIFSRGLGARTPPSLSFLSCKMEIKVSLS